jgi:glutaminase
VSRISATGLASLTQAQLNAWAIQAQAHSQGGQLPNYIPLLAQANSTGLAIQTRSIEGQITLGHSLILLECSIRPPKTSI